MEEASKESAPRKTAFLDVTGAYEQERYVRLPRLYGAVVAGVFALSCFVAIAIGIPLMQVTADNQEREAFVEDATIRLSQSRDSMRLIGARLEVLAQVITSQATRLPNGGVVVGPPGPPLGPTTLTRPVFERAVNLLLPLMSLDSVEWIQYVTQTNAAATVAGILTNYGTQCPPLVPGFEPGVFFVIALISNVEANSAALCFNFDSEEVRHNTIVRSIETGDAVATPPLQLVQGGLGSVAMLAVVRANSTLLEHTRTLGLVTQVVRPQSVAKESLSTKNVWVAVFGTDALGETVVMLWSGPNRVRVRSVSDLAPYTHVCMNLQVLDQTWVQCDVMPATGPVKFSPLGAFVMAMLVSLIIGELLIALVFSLWHRHREFMASNARLQRAKEASFLNLGHELRTPLTTIKLAVNELAANEANRPRSDDGVQLLNVVSMSVNLLLGLINDVLELGSIVSGKILLHRTWFQLDELLEEVVTLLRPQAASREVSIEWKGSEETARVSVFLDRNRVRQVLVNLCTNAIKYGGGVVVVNALFKRKSEALGGAEGRELCLTVTDNGPGLTAEQVAKLFKFFSRLQENGDGAGLGLCIAKELVERMDGTIGVASAPGKGSEFFVCLPVPVSNAMVIQSRTGSTVGLCQADAMNDANGLYDLSVVGVTDLAADPVTGISEGDFLTFECPAPVVLRILVVDDTEVNLKLIVRLLERLGHVAVPVDSGEAALDAVVGGQAFDAIFLDFFMPGMSGGEACLQIRRQPGYARVPIVCLTASESIDGEYGFSEFLRKPFAVHQLEQILEKCTQREGVIN